GRGGGRGVRLGHDRGDHGRRLNLGLGRDSGAAAGVGRLVAAREQVCPDGREGQRLRRQRRDLGGDRRSCRRRNRGGDRRHHRGGGERADGQGCPRGRCWRGGRGGGGLCRTGRRRAERGLLRGGDGGRADRW